MTLSFHYRVKHHASFLSISTITCQTAWWKPICINLTSFQVSRNLFRWTKEVGYADYYERALTNGVLSIQRGREPGIMIYMLPLGHGESKARSDNEGWGTKYDSFWCCYGTGRQLSELVSILISEFKTVNVKTKCNSKPHIHICSRRQRYNC